MKYGDPLADSRENFPGYRVDRFPGQPTKFPDIACDIFVAFVRSRDPLRAMFFSSSSIFFFMVNGGGGRGKNTWKYIFQTMIRVSREKRTKCKKCRYIC